MVKKTHRLRVLLVAFGSALIFCAIEARLFHLQVRKHAHYTELANRQQKKTVKLGPRRGDILDRRQYVLATSTLRDTLYFCPAQLVKDPPPDTAARIGRLLGIPPDKIAQAIEKKKKTKLASKVEPEVSDAMKLLEDDLDLPAGVISYEKESKRNYPQGDMAGAILGYTKSDDLGDNIGNAGIELACNDSLKGRPKQQRIEVNSWRQGIAPLDDSVLAGTLGNTVVLTLDSQIQLYAQKALRKRVGEVQAQGGVAIVMDVETGALLAMATCPDFDPNDFSRATDEQRRNRALTDPIEIGSVMKILTAAILIDNHLLSVDETVDCQGGVAIFEGGRKIKDTHPLDVVPFRHAFAESSNVAAVKLGLRLEPNLYYNSLKKFGLGDKLGIDIPGEGSGILRPVNRWTRDSRVSLPIGYETSMTALQVVSCVAAIGNKGIRMKPYLVDRIVSPEGRTIDHTAPVQVARVSSPETAETMISLMESVIEEGTGKTANVPGYSVAGKSGTTRKSQILDEKKFFASFAGLIPAKNPRIAIYVYVDEPDPKIEYYGGKVSGPVFAEIAQNAMRILGIAPDKPKDLAKAEEPNKGTGPRELETIDGIGAFVDSPPSPNARERTLAQAEPDIRELREAGSAPVQPGVMPSFTGLTMSEALDRASRAEIELKVKGSGLATNQEPPAGVPVKAGMSATVIFSPFSKEASAPAPRRREEGGKRMDSPALPSR